MLTYLFFICFISIPSAFTQNYTTNSGVRETPLNPHAPKIYDINLDLNYTERWKEVIADYKDVMDEATAEMGFKDGSIFAAYGIPKAIPDQILKEIDYSLISSYNQEFADEIQAMALLANMKFNELTILNFIYDLTAQCTSIVIQDTQNKTIHARNLDFPNAAYLSKLVFQGRYFRNGTLLYEAISMAGYTGLLTGQKNGAFSLSINQYLLTTESSLLDNMLLFFLDFMQIAKGKLTPPLVARRAFESVDNYEELLEYLSDVDTISRVYYIIGGAEEGQGAVITKYRDSVENITTLNVEDGAWYVVQTNYIRNETDPDFDNRASAASAWLDEIGRDQLTPERLLDDVMSKYPVFNNETIHTTIMQPSGDYFNTTEWW